MSSTARPLIAALSVTMLAGCAQPSPEERVESVRAQTTVELLSFAVSETPVEEPAAAAGAEGEPAPPAAEGAAEAAVEGAAEGAEGADAEAAAAPVSTDIILDLLVSTEAEEPLPGITVEYEHVDASQGVKENRRLWVETPNLVRGVGAQLSVVVPDVEYEEGDGFSISVRPSVPPAERSEYREFQGVGGS